MAFPSPVFPLLISKGIESFSSLIMDVLYITTGCVPTRGNRRAEEIQTIHTYVAAAVETDAGRRFPTDETKDSLPPFPYFEG